MTDYRVLLRLKLMLLQFGLHGKVSLKQGYDDVIGWGKAVLMTIDDRGGERELK